MKRTYVIGYALAAALCAGQANAEELTGTLKNIKDTGAITLGFRDSSIPFSYLDDNQKPIGYAMDICYKIVDAVKKELKLDKIEVKLNPVTSSTRIPLLANGTIDLECGSTTNNAERQKQISFTNTHFLTASRYVSKKANKINAIDDLVADVHGVTDRLLVVVEVGEWNRGVTKAKRDSAGVLDVLQRPRQFFGVGLARAERGGERIADHIRGFHACTPCLVCIVCLRISPRTGAM
ncbi:MAG TPA: transporter substrate-binding domain-containing protein [Bradyrhizobium sp.]|nr:transporter substrate-binding domain-containing protein [Bradyrhizobium sp.]